jgi:hypothetical protein
MTATTGFYDLHGVCLRAASSDRAIARRLDAVFSPFACSARPVDVDLALGFVTALASWQPAGEIISESRLLTCALDGARLSAHFPRWGTLDVDLATGMIRGELLAEALDHYGAFDDMVIIALGPLLRRRGFFALHAFAAASGARAALLVGDIGAGKTTTGLSLLAAGWKLVSNDSPLLTQADDGIMACAYPGLLAAYDDTLARFPALRRFMGAAGDPPAKRAFPADAAFADVWQRQAIAGVLLFPKVTAGLTTSRVEPLSPRDALLALVPNSIERWDRPFIAPHLAMLQTLVQQTPAYRLLLAPDVPALPNLIAGLLAV